MLLSFMKEITIVTSKEAFDTKIISDFEKVLLHVN